MKNGQKFLNELADDIIVSGMKLYFVVGKDGNVVAVFTSEKEAFDYAKLRNDRAGSYNYNDFSVEGPEGHKVFVRR